MQDGQRPALGFVGPAYPVATTDLAGFLDRFAELYTATSDGVIQDIPAMVALGYRLPLRIKYRRRAIFTLEALVLRDKPPFGGYLLAELGLEPMNPDVQVAFQFIQVCVCDRDFIASIAENGAQILAGHAI
jgi:hypothetical protein